MKLNVMKYFLIAFVVLTSAYTAAANEPMQMTMTTSKSGEVWFRLGGTGTATIDWGDRTPIETIMLSDTVEIRIEHNYSSTNVRTITITGENIMYLDCSDNQLIDLDISKNIALTHLDVNKNQLTSLDVYTNYELKYLDCSYNLFTAVALNSLFRTLHTNAPLIVVISETEGYITPENFGTRKIVLIGNNPGTDACDRSIAESKQWTFGDLPNGFTYECDDEAYLIVEEMPKFPGDITELLRFLQENVEYPERAKANNIQGRVFFQFVITAQGTIGKVRVLKGLDPLLDAAAVEAVKKLPPFIPGKQGGIAVSVWYQAYITFQFE